jgi:phage tail P2-like protein
VDLSDVSIIKLLPPNLAHDKNVRMMCEAFDTELRRIIGDIPGIGMIPNLVRKQITDNVLLDLLAWQFHCDFYNTGFSIEKKQEIILKSLDWHTRKGTPSVVEEIVSAVFSRAEVQEWFDYGGLPYRFKIGTEDEMPDAAARENLIRAINSVKNTRSFLEKITSLVYLEDAFDVTDYLLIIVRVNRIEDYYGNRFKFNGAAKFDGHTQNEWMHINGKFDGKCKFNGKLTFNGVGKARIPYRLTPPFKFSSWIVDTLNISIGDITHEDTQRAAFQFDGSVKFDGGSKFNGISQHPINSPIASRKNIKFNGGIKFDGKYQFNGVYGNKIKIGHADNALSDVVGSSDDVLTAVYKHHHFNGANNFDGSIKFNGVPSVMVE